MAANPAMKPVKNMDQKLKDLMGFELATTAGDAAEIEAELGLVFWVTGELGGGVEVELEVEIEVGVDVVAEVGVEFEVAVAVDFGVEFEVEKGD